VYRTIVELEALADQGSELAAERASALRATSAASLLELGDQYWDQPGAAPFAADYYAAVLLFDPEQARARERAPSTHGELGGLRRQAEGQTFSAAELAAGESLAALAQPNVAERRNRVERLFASNTLPLSTEARLEQVLGVTERRSQPQKTGVSVQQPSPVADTERTEPEAPEEAAAPDPPDPLPDLRPSPAAARVELTRAQTALRRGAVDTAEQHFHRALRFDHRSLAALIGLAEVGFQRGAHDSAVRYAEKATRLHPPDPRGYMIAGNAYLRMLRYQAALAAYRRAGALGHEPAGRRIAKLEHLLGIEASDRKGTP
jgi:tetratricopeptide (TPR) repeat protein